MEDGTEAESRRLLLACGVRDELPAVDGLAERWGRSVLHCVYCHGYEFADRPIAIHARGRTAMESAASLLHLSNDLLICTDGPAELTEEDRRGLARHRVKIVETRLTRVSGDSPRLALHFEDGSTVERAAIYVKTVLGLASPLPVELGLPSRCSSPPSGRRRLADHGPRCLRRGRHRGAQGLRRRGGRQRRAGRRGAGRRPGPGGLRRHLVRASLRQRTTAMTRP
jgi:hypothetical protein